MNPVLVVSLAGFAVGLFVTVWFVVAGDREPRLLAQRVARYGDTGYSVPHADERSRRMQKPFAERVLKPVLERMGGRMRRSFGRKKLQDIELQLEASGGMWGLSPAAYLATQYVALLGGIGIGAGVGYLIGGTGDMLPGGAFFGVLGFLIPRMKLQRAIKARREEILLGMPNALDLLTISVEAGLGFDAALLRVAEKYSNALSEEFNQVLTEMKLGRPRRDALRAMAERVQVDDLTNFVQAVVQSEQMGTGLANVLRIQSQEMRRRRRQRAEEAGAKAPIKMLMPMACFIFPTLFIVLLGPAALSVIHQFTGQ